MSRSRRRTRSTLAGRKRAAAPPATHDAPQAAAVARIKDEHLALASVLYGLRQATAHIREHGAPDFRLLFALLDYIVEFPERLHHPKEDEYLFRALATRCAGARSLIAELAAEHVRGDALIGALRDALLRYSRVGADAYQPFADAVEDYVAFHWQHMGKEEEVLLPLAQRHLTTEDWSRIDAAFRANDNPLAGLPPKAHTDALFRRILELVPAHAPVATRADRT